MQNISDKLIVALDVDTLDKAKYFVDILYPSVKLFKVGSQLFTIGGPAAIKMIGDKGAKVFLDLKFHDIPNTVYSAVASGTSSSIAVFSIPGGLGEIRAEDKVREAMRPPVFMMTLHTVGGMEMLKAAVRGATESTAQLNIEKRPYLVGVTVLTSEKSDNNTSKLVMERANLAKSAGLDGVVCSVQEAQKIRNEFGKDFLIVTPGIRPKGYKSDDQARVDTPQAAIEAGANFIVVGRPIIEAKDPLSAAEKILNLSDK